MGALPRPPKGEVESYEWKDGRTVSFYLRVPFKGRRVRVTLGTNHEGWTQKRAEVELERIMERVERGTWEPPTNERQADPTELVVETLHVTASRWYGRKEAEGLEPKTETDYKWRLGWILKYKPHEPTANIDAKWVDQFKVWLSGQVSDRGKPLSTRSRNMVLNCLAMVLDDAVKYDHLPANAARGKDVHIEERPTKKQHFLLPDMIVDLLDAAGAWESDLPRNQRFGRRALLAVLTLAGTRVEEEGAARLRDLDIHSEILRVDRSKTEAGEREIDLTAYLLGELRPHLATLPKIMGRDPTPDDPIFPTRNGEHRNQSNVRRFLTEAVEKANKGRAKRNKMLIPEDLTPHDLRRTFACLCFWAGRELPYVQSQIGHKDGRMTLEAYAFAAKRKRVDRALVWELMHFSDEEARRPTNRPLASDEDARMPGLDEQSQLPSRFRGTPEA